MKIGSPTLRSYAGKCTQADAKTLRLKSFFSAVLEHGDEGSAEPGLVLASGSANLLYNTIQQLFIGDEGIYG